MAVWPVSYAVSSVKVWAREVGANGVWGMWKVSMQFFQPCC